MLFDSAPESNESEKTMPEICRRSICHFPETPPVSRSYQEKSIYLGAGDASRRWTIVGVGVDGQNRFTSVPEISENL